MMYGGTDRERFKATGLLQHIVLQAVKEDQAIKAKASKAKAKASKAKASKVIYWYHCYISTSLTLIRHHLLPSTPLRQASTILLRRLCHVRYATALKKILSSLLAAIPIVKAVYQLKSNLLTNSTICHCSAKEKTANALSHSRS